jgi:hypothetical protein
MTIGGGAKNPKLICGRGKECGHSQPYEEGTLEAAAQNGANGNGSGDDAGADAGEAPKRGGKGSSASVSP